MKVEQAKRCFLCRFNTRVGGEWDSGLAETSGVKAAAQHNPPYESIDLIGTAGCGTHAARKRASSAHPDRVLDELVRRKGS
jgi:hypothetical protein